MIENKVLEKNPQLSTTSQKDPWGWAVTAVTSIASSLGSVSEDNTAADRTNGSGRDGWDDASQRALFTAGIFQQHGGHMLRILKGDIFSVDCHILIYFQGFRSHRGSPKSSSRHG